MAMSRALDRSDSAVESSVVGDYYRHTDFFTTAEGILKAFSIVACVVSSALFLAGGGCAGRLTAGGGALALVSSAALALLYTGLLLSVPVHMPLTWLVADMVVSTVLSVLLVVFAVLRAAVCDTTSLLDYFNVPLAATNGVLVTGSAALSYRAVTRRWDERRATSDRARRPPPAPLTEQDA